ncbi:MAG: lipopolysaccharide kinase InaA family protein [Bacteroidota bacterium]
MGTIFRINNSYKDETTSVKNFIENVSDMGQVVYDGSRNQIRYAEIAGKLMNIKVFKKPNLINQFAYRFIRKSKAERSFLYAEKLLKRGINTPEPIAYQVNLSLLGVLKSFYVSAHLEYDFTFRELTTDKQMPNHTQILKEFTRFTYKMHQQGVFFLDHSPGNTLITKKDNTYDFALVDLNRMQFKQLSFNDKIKNFSRLTTDEEIMKVISQEYARLIAKNPEEIHQLMMEEVKKFRTKFDGKKKLKRQLKFWK